MCLLILFSYTFQECSLFKWKIICYYWPHTLIKEIFSFCWPFLQLIKGWYWPIICKIIKCVALSVVDISRNLKRWVRLEAQTHKNPIRSKQKINNRLWLGYFLISVTRPSWDTCGFMNSLVKVDQRQHHLSGCRSAPVQRVALAHHQDWLVLLWQCPLAVDAFQYQWRIWVFITADRQGKARGSLSLNVHLGRFEACTCVKCTSCHIIIRYVT